MKVAGKAENVVWHQSSVTCEDRNRLNQHKSGIVWFTGLSASGKSTIANAVESELFELGVRTYVLDGDNVRHGLNADLGFSREHRKENLRRIAEVSKLFADAGIVVFCAFITPFEDDRDYIKSLLGDSNFSEVYIKCNIEVCIDRDPKGLYKKALAGEIKEYTGISSPYDEPKNPDLVIDTEKSDIEESVALLLEYLKNNFNI